MQAARRGERHRPEGTQGGRAGPGRLRDGRGGGGAEGGRRERKGAGAGRGDEGRAAGLRGRRPWSHWRGPAAAAADAKASAAGGSCAPAAAEAAAIAPRASESPALALASWCWGCCRRCGGCCCAWCRRGLGWTETPAFGAFVLAHTRSQPPESRGRGVRAISVLRLITRCRECEKEEG